MHSTEKMSGDNVCLSSTDPDQAKDTEKMSGDNVCLSSTDPDQAKDTEKGTLPNKGGKRNLRSSRSSPGKARPSPRGVSRKL